MGSVVCSKSHKHYGLCKSQLFCFIEHAGKKHQGEKERGMEGERERNRSRDTGVLLYEEKLLEIVCVNGFGLSEAKKYL